MECTLTQPGDKNKKKWEEGAAAKAWGGEELQKLISADQTAQMSYSGIFYYSTLNELLIPKPRIITEYVYAHLSEAVTDYIHTFL